MRKVPSFSVLVLLAVVVLAGCSGAKTAATPQAQAELNAQADMDRIATDYFATATAWGKGCNPAARTIEVKKCNEWDVFDTSFRVRYRAVGGTLAPADIKKLKDDLEPWKR